MHNSKLIIRHLEKELYHHVPNEQRCKNAKQNTSKPNPETHWNSHTLWSNENSRLDSRGA